MKCKISTLVATKEFCSPDFVINFLELQFRVTTTNGMCSFGVCNVGHYNTTFTKKDVADQRFNPAGQFNYSQLIDQAKNQTYVLTELFGNTQIPKSMFSVFLPNKALPTTDFLSAPAPKKPKISPTTTCKSTPAPTSMYINICMYMIMA